MARSLVCLLLIATAVAAEDPAVVRAIGLIYQATMAAEAKDNATFLAKAEEAASLRPDFPRALRTLATAQTANERPEDAVATLERLAALGVGETVEKAEEFAALRDRPDFKAVARKLAVNLHPQGDGESAFLLRDVTGLIEGIAWRESTGEFLFGDVNARTVWARKKDGALRRLTPESDELFGVFGLAIDDASGTLWAATTAVPEMRGFAAELEGAAGVAEIDLASGAVRRVLTVARKAGAPRPPLISDLALAPDGTVFAIDGGTQAIWQLAPNANALQPVAESDEFIELQGVVVLAGGAALLVSDHANGLLRVDLRSRAVTRLDFPDTTFVGLDGLALAPDGSVIAIQSGTRPNRILRVTLDAAAEAVEGIKILESGHLTMAAPSLGCVGQAGNFYFIANPGWSRFDGTEGKPTAPRSIAVLKTKL